MTTLGISYPGSADVAQIVAGLRGLLAAAGRSQRLFTGRRFICLELWANGEEITHLLTVPAGKAAIDVLSSAIPGVRIETAERRTAPLTGVSVGVRLAGPMPGVLRTDMGAETATALLASVSGLRQGETVVVQWLIAPLHRSRTILGHPEELDRVQRAKRSETETVACGRVAAWAPHARRARELAFAPARVLRLASGPDGRLSARRSLRVPRQVIGMRPPILVWGSHLNVAELIPLIGWPASPTPIRGLSRGGSRLLPVPSGTPTSGPSVGSTTFPGPSSQIRLGTEGRLRHLHVIGPTGVGKTTLLTRLIAADIEAGRGVIVFDPLGDLTDLVCARIPKERVDDVMVVGPTDTERPVGFNVLAGTDRHRTTDFVVGVLARLFASSWGPRTADILRAGLLTLGVTSGSTLADLPDLLTNQTFRRRHVAGVMDDRALAGFWTWYESLSDAERSAVIAPVLNKIRAVVLRPEAVRVLCHPQGRLDLKDVFTRRRIVIVRLAKGLVGEDTASLIGGLVLAKLWQTILARAAVDPQRRHPVFVYLDEFQDYLRLPIGMGDMLAQARGMGVGLVVAHQHLGQLSKTIRRDVLANVGSRVIFQTTFDDSRLLARDLEPHLNAADLRGLAAREIAVRIATPERILPPVTGRTMPAPDSVSVAATVRARSQTLFGRPLPDNEAPAGDNRGPVGRKPRDGGGR